MIRNDKLREIGKDICSPEKISREYEYLCSLEKIIDCKEFYAEVDGDIFEPLSVLTYDSIEKIRNIIRDEYNNKVDVLYDYVYGENVNNETVSNENENSISENSENTINENSAYDYRKYFQKRFKEPMDLAYVDLNKEEHTTCPFCGNHNILIAEDENRTILVSEQLYCVNCGAKTLWYKQPIKGKEVIWWRETRNLVKNELSATKEG